MAQPQKKEKVVLEAAIREGTGKQQAGSVRREGFVPGVVYKEGEKAVSVQVAARELNRVLHTKAGSNVLIALEFSGKAKTVLVKELQHHPVSHQVIHVDFHEVSLTKKITVSVPLAFKGESIGVKQQGGVIEHLRWEIEVECLPTEIPSEIAMDVSRLEKGVTLHVRDLSVPAGVRVITDPEQPVIACVEPKMEEAPAAAEEAGKPEEPEVIKQKKPEEAAEGEAAPEGKEKKEKSEPKKG